MKLFETAVNSVFMKDLPEWQGTMERIVDSATVRSSSYYFVFFLGHGHLLRRG